VQFTVTDEFLFGTIETSTRTLVVAPGNPGLVSIQDITPNTSEEFEEEEPTYDDPPQSGGGSTFDEESLADIFEISVLVVYSADSRISLLNLFQGYPEEEWAGYLTDNFNDIVKRSEVDDVRFIVSSVSMLGENFVWAPIVAPVTTDQLNRIAEQYSSDPFQIYKRMRESGADLALIVVKNVRDDADESFHKRRTRGISCRIGARNPISAIGIVDAKYILLGHSLLHEVGHLIGMRHQLADDSLLTPYANGHGYVNSDNYRDVMSTCAKHKDGHCFRIGVFSNPTDFGVHGESDNSAVLSEAASQIAALSDTAVPLAAGGSVARYCEGSGD
jgi:hypothetical protein